MGERVAVVGATGYTGRLVVAELLRRGVDVVAIGRNPDRLRSFPPEVEPRVADAADAAALAEALDGCRAVVSCVGSFIDHGEAVVAAAVAASVHYVDTSGEFPFLQRVFDVHDGPARAAGVAVVPGMAFYSAPADLVAALAVRALGRVPEAVEIGSPVQGDPAHQPPPGRVAVPGPGGRAARPRPDRRRPAALPVSGRRRSGDRGPLARR